MVVAVWVGWVLYWVVVGCEGQNPYSHQYVRQDYGHVFIDDEADRWLCVIFGLCIIRPAAPARPELGLVYNWTQLEFDYPSAAARQEAIDREEFIPGKPAPIDVDVQYNYNSNRNNRVFITMPRFQTGVPAAVGIVTDKSLNGNPIIKPYPSWSWHRNPKRCKRERIVSVYRIFIDECQRLWILDTGRYLDEIICLPQLLAFDLQTDRLIHRYEIPKAQIESRSILVTPMVDVRDPHNQCRDTFVYLADCRTYSIIVYDVQKSVSWRVTDKTMYPYPNYGTITIEGDSFELMDGILGMALEPYVPGRDRKLFYHALTSPTENWVYTSYLRDRSRFIHNPESSPEIFHTYKGTRNTQSVSTAIDKDGIMYFGLMADVTIDCWNTATPYGPPTMDIIASNKETLQFATGVKIITNTRTKQELWILTSRFQKVGAGTLNPSELNFRILAGKVEDLIEGTICRNGGSTRRPPTSGGTYRFSSNQRSQGV